MFSKSTTAPTFSQLLTEAEAAAMRRYHAAVTGTVVRRRPGAYPGTYVVEVAVRELALRLELTIEVES